MSFLWLATGWLLAAALTAAASGCSERDAGGLRPASRTDAAADGGITAQHWVGRVEGTDIRVGVVGTPGESARMFFCGGPDTYQTATRWVIVELEEPDNSFEYEEMGWRIRGLADGESLVGEIEREGDEPRSLRGEPAARGTLAGLYEGASQCGRIGLIVMQPNAAQEPSAQGACLGAGLPQQVNPILPIEQSAGRIRVTVGETEAFVREAAPPVL